VDWLSDRVQEQAGGDSGPLKIMYRVDGSSDLDEETLPHLDGYQSSRPVRIGTAPPTSCSWTSTERPWSASTTPTGTALT
jgi:hypothetical protein